MLAYVDTGGAGRPVVLVHGGGDNAGTWDELLQPLSAFGRVIAPDLTGHGQSPPFVDGPVHFHDDVVELLDHVTAGDDPPILVGHSLGAAVVLAIARSRPAAGILLLDGLPHRGILDPPLPFDAAGYRDRMATLGFGALRAESELERLVALDPHPAQVRRAHLALPDGRFQRRPSLDESVALARAGRDEANPYRDLGLFRDVRVRTIALSALGGNSADVRDRLDELLPASSNFTTRWLPASHAIHWDRPSDVVGAVAELAGRR